MARGWYRANDSFSEWPAYVPVAQRRQQALREVAALRKKGREISPVTVEGRRIASTFWGKSWCTNLEAYSDYANRLPRGRTYVRNGSVVHLGITEGKVDALVRGTSMYTVEIRVAPLARSHWRSLVGECSGKIDSLVELLQGKLSSAVMEVVTRPERGLFPNPKDITLSCSCPDWASMCKHVAAVLYGVGARLDAAPDLLFRLRAVDPTALLVTASVGRTASSTRGRDRVLPSSAIGSVFGIELDDAEPAPASATPGATPAIRPKRAAKAAVEPRAKPRPVPAVARKQARAEPERARAPAGVRLTITELAAAGVRVVDLQSLLQSGDLVATREDGVFDATPAAKARLLGRKRRRS